MDLTFKKVFCQGFHDLAFTLKEGTIIGVTGQGKSTFLKIIDGFYKISGEAYLGSYSYQKNLSFICQKVNLIEQDLHSQIFLRTVEEYIAFLIHYYKIKMEKPRDKVLSAFKMVGLTENYLDKDIQFLSSSEQKQLQIAISLLSNPDVLLFDEPFLALDRQARKKIERLLIKLKERYHKIIVIASCDSNELYQFTEEMIFLKKGTVLKQEKTEKIYQDVKFLTKHQYEIPEIVLFTDKVRKEKNVPLSYHKDIRDLIKDVYKHV